MCGLTLVISKNTYGFTVQQQNVFASLMYLSGGYRGRDGAGVAVVDTIGNVKIAKDGESVDHFLHTGEFEELDRAAFKNGWAMIGHNRAATRGVVLDKNSHPFVIDDNIVLCHNGTFNEDHKKIRNTDVDSEVIAHILHENEDVEAALRKINAAYALIWYNVGTKTIHVIRNLARTLWFMETENSYIFSSEGVFLDFVIAKHNLKPIDGPFIMKEYYMSTFKLLDNKQTETDGKEMDVSYYKHSVSEPTNYPVINYHPFRGYTEDPPEEDATSVADILVSTYNPTIISKVLDIMGKDVPGILNRDWNTIIQSRRYETNKVISVLIHETVEVDDTCKDFVFLGQTLDGSNTYTLFMVKNIQLQDALDMVEHGLYEMEVVGFQWRRWEEKFPVDTKKSIDDWMGVAFIHGKDIKAIPISDAVYA